MIDDRLFACLIDLEITANVEVGCLRIAWPRIKRSTAVQLSVIFSYF